MKWICRTADHIVTVSENSKRDIVNLLGVDPQKVTNTYQAVTIPEALRNKPESTLRCEVEGTFGLTYKEYFLFFGSIEPKKNIGRMIEAYLGSGVETPLVIVGAQAWKADQELRLLEAQEVRSQLKPKRVAKKIVRLEYASFPTLVNLIRAAKGVFFPSLYEGFGLPILESMLLGTPVLTSNTSSIPEIAGDAALQVNPYDVGEIAAGIRALDKEESVRLELTQKGLRQAARFGEAEYRQRLVGVYHQVMAETVVAQ